MTSLISVEEEKPKTMAPSGKRVIEESSGTAVTALLVSINVGATVVDSCCTTSATV